MKTVFFSFLTSLILLSSTQSQASGQQEFWNITGSSRDMIISPADVFTGEGEPAMDVEMCRDTLTLKHLGFLDESVTLESDWTDKPCRPWSSKMLVRAVFSLFKRTTEEDGKGPGPLYCVIQLQTLSHEVLFSTWYWKVQDSSACR